MDRTEWAIARQIDWRTLYWGFWASLALHGSLLLLPFGEAIEPPEPEAIEVVFLPASPPVEPDPEPVTPAPVETEPEPVTPAPVETEPEPIPEEVAAEPIPEPVPEQTNLETQKPRPYSPPSEIPPQKKERISLPSKPPVSPPSSPPRKQIEADFYNTIAEIDSKTDGFENTPLSEILGLFGEAEQIPLFCDDRGHPRAEIASFRWFDYLNPRELETIVNSRLEERSLTVTAIGNYGGGRIYRIDRGEFQVYLNFVPVTAGAEDNGTLLVVWNRLPF